MSRPALPTDAFPPPAQRLYAHLAWTTVARLPLVGPRRRAATESHLLAACRWLDVQPVEACVLPDRVHLLVRFRAGQSLSDLARRIQDVSEAVLTTAGHPVRWSRRFAAETVSPGDVRRVRRRIAHRADAARAAAAAAAGAAGAAGAVDAAAGAEARRAGRGPPGRRRPVDASGGAA